MNLYDIEGVIHQRLKTCFDCPNLIRPNALPEKQARERAACSPHRCHNHYDVLCAGPIREGQTVGQLAQEIQKELFA